MKLKALVFIFSALLSQTVFAQPHSIFLVRHAEKTSATADELNDAGKQRAQCLAQTLKDAGIGAIFVTDTIRAQQTAEPLATALKIKPTMLKAIDYSGLVRGVTSATKNVLVVGHSNTIPVLIQQLRAGAAPNIADNDYDHMYIIEMTPDGAAGLATVRYCAFTQDAAPAGRPVPTPRKSPIVVKPRTMPATKPGSPSPSPTPE